MIGLPSPRQAEQYSFLFSASLCSTFQYDTLLDQHEFFENILASRDIYHENGQIVYNVTIMDDLNFVICGRCCFLRTEENNK